LIVDPLYSSKKECCVGWQPVSTIQLSRHGSASWIDLQYILVDTPGPPVPILAAVLQIRIKHGNTSGIRLERPAHGIFYFRLLSKNFRFRLRILDWVTQVRVCTDMHFTQRPQRKIRKGREVVEFATP